MTRHNESLPNKKIISVKPTGGNIAPSLAEHAESVRYGMSEERRIIALLSSLYGCEVRKSTHLDDTKYDVDAWLGKSSISIKSQPIALKTGNLGFELEVLDAVSEQWEKSWYYNGTAQYYVIAVGECLYQCSKAKLIDYVEEHGWDSVKELSPHTQTTQQHHRHRNARNGLVRLTSLLDACVMRLIHPS